MRDLRQWGGWPVAGQLGDHTPQVFMHGSCLHVVLNRWTALPALLSRWLRRDVKTKAKCDKQ